ALRVPLPERAPPHPAAVVLPPPAPPVPPEQATFLAADAAGSSVALYDGPGAAAPRGSLSNPQPYGVPLAFRVTSVRGDWLQVALPARPNGSTAWVRRAEVTLRTVPNRVVASVSGRSVTVYAGHSDVVLFRAPIAVGRSGTPTPTGDLFYVDAVRATGNPGGVYGPFQLRVSAFSEVLYSFGGGPGQVAFHGTNSPGLVGSAVSNGCMRMYNGDITTLVGLAPVGTPVRIVP
ncbi:MAG TPA: L,D-transpeptidase, partial [Acidimicrobiales bacterium]